MIEGFAFVLGMFVSLLIMAAFLRWMAGPVPIERPLGGQGYIFRLVRREDRAAYVRIMRRTLAVQMRDMNRAMTKATRQIGRALLPAFERLAAVLSRLDR